MQIRIKRFDKTLPLPASDPGAAAFDVTCREATIIEPKNIGLVSVNVAIEIPAGHFLLIAARSSTSWKKGLMLANGIGVVDPFYCGDEDEIKIQLFNISDEPVSIEPGEMLAQALLMKHEPIEWLEVESFGHKGHGGYRTDQRTNSSPTEAK